MDRVECWMVLEDVAHLEGKCLWSICTWRLMLAVVQKDIMGLRGHQIPLASILHVVDPLMSIWLTKRSLSQAPPLRKQLIQMLPCCAVEMATWSNALRWAWRWWWFGHQVQLLRSHDPVDCSLTGSSVYGISQARMLEWVSIPFSRGSSQPRDQTCVCLQHSRQSTVLQADSLPTEPLGKP